MNRKIIARPLTRDAFSDFGDVIETESAVHFPINNGKCERFHDLANVEAAGPNARVLISIFRGTAYPIPLNLTMVERHPFGSQAFYPLSANPFLVIVSRDGSAGPEKPEAFLTSPWQGVSYRRNAWHAVLTPIIHDQDFIVIDRGGDGNNLEEFHFDQPWEIDVP